MNMNIEFDIPKGYCINKELSTSTTVVFTNNIILVPDNIKIYHGRIVFPNNKQVLSQSNGYYTVFTIPNIINLPKYQLIPIERKDLKQGDIAFRTEVSELVVNEIHRYCIILNASEYAYIRDDKGIIDIAKNTFIHWYKVLPL
jgi:hypothetical protein